MEIDFKTKVSALNPRQREWFDEIQELLPAELVSSPEELDETFHALKEVGLEVIDRPACYQSRDALDGGERDFDKKEKEMIQVVGKNLGFNPQEVDQLVLYGFELMAQ